MRILVLNAGSSSLKAQVLRLPEGTAELTFSVERLGTEAAQVSARDAAGQPLPEPATPLQQLEEAFAHLANLVRAQPPLDALGHRVVHGGEFFQEAARVTPAVQEAIRRCVPLAPLHNPANLKGIEAGTRFFPGLPQVAVFDTAFHHTLLPESRTFALPSTWQSPDLPLRRYGFHGTSHRYVLEEVAAQKAVPGTQLNLISFHLGNGCSATAIRQGVSIDTTMGLTPLGGLMMGTRPGDLDPGVLLHLLREGVSPEELDHGLNRESGLRALAGSNDLRDVFAQRDAGAADAGLAIDRMLHLLRKTLGAYWALLEHVDAVTFTGGIGEHAPEIRARLLQGLDAWGLTLDTARNTQSASGARSLQAAHGTTDIWVIPANEELAIARETARVLQP